MNEVVGYEQREIARKLSEYDRLSKFERLVKSLMSSLYYAVLWTWIVLGIVIPILSYYKPMPQDGFIQACVLAAVFWILFAMAHALKAIGRLE